MDASTPAARLLSLLENVSRQKRRCRHCGALLFLVRINGYNGRLHVRGTQPHLEDCPRYRQPPPGSQESLFGEQAATAEAFEPRR